MPSLAAEIPHALANLNVHGGRSKRTLVTLESKHHLVYAGPKYVLDGEAPLDFAFARFVRFAVDGRFRMGAVSPVPFHRGAIEILVIVGTALELRGQNDASRRHADDRLRSQ